jgi:hypothetical protein
MSTSDVQRHVGDVGATIRQLMGHLDHLARRLEQEDILSLELRDGVHAVCGDLLDDAAETLHRLGSMSEEDILRRHLEASDLVERLAAHGAA